eukprot:5497325-Amphidinium_carterae.1
MACKAVQTLEGWTRCIPDFEVGYMGLQPEGKLACATYLSQTITKSKQSTEFRAYPCVQKKIHYQIKI